MTKPNEARHADLITLNDLIRHKKLLAIAEKERDNALDVAAKNHWGRIELREALIILMAGARRPIDGSALGHGYMQVRIEDYDKIVDLFREGKI